MPLKAAHKISRALRKHGEHIVEVRNGGLRVGVFSHAVGKLRIIRTQPEQLPARAATDARIRHMVELVGKAGNHVMKLAKVIVSLVIGNARDKQGNRKHDAAHREEPGLERKVV